MGQSTWVIVERRDGEALPLLTVAERQEALDLVRELRQLGRDVNAVAIDTPALDALHRRGSE